jgi:hypothetical protein
MVAAAEQVIRPDAPIAFFSSFFLRRILDAIRGAPVNSSDRPLKDGQRISQHGLARRAKQQA